MNPLELTLRLLQHRADVVGLCNGLGWCYSERIAPALEALGAITKVKGCDPLQATIWLGSEVERTGHDPSFVLAAGVELYLGGAAEVST